MIGRQTELHTSKFSSLSATHIRFSIPYIPESMALKSNLICLAYAQRIKASTEVLHLQNSINTIIKRRPEDRLWYQIVIK